MRSVARIGRSDMNYPIGLVVSFLECVIIFIMSYALSVFFMGFTYRDYIFQSFVLLQLIFTVLIFISGYKFFSFSKISQFIRSVVFWRFLLHAIIVSIAVKYYSDERIVGFAALDLVVLLIGISFISAVFGGIFNIFGYLGVKLRNKAKD